MAILQPKAYKKADSVVIRTGFLYSISENRLSRLHYFLFSLYLYSCKV